MPSKIFTKEYLKSILNKEIEGASVISDEIVDHRRWAVAHELIFKDVDGLFYKTSYDRGATEYQDEGADFHSDEVKCIQVHQVEQTVLVWEEC
jgi:hypothetical protein